MRAPDSAMPAEAPPKYDIGSSEPRSAYVLPPNDNAVIPSPQLPAYNLEGNDNATTRSLPLTAGSRAERALAARTAASGPEVAAALTTTVAAAEPIPRSAWYSTNLQELLEHDLDAHSEHSTATTLPPYTARTLEEGQLQLQLQPPPPIYTQARSQGQSPAPRPCPLRTHFPAHRHCSRRCQFRSQDISELEVRRQAEYEERYASHRQAQVQLPSRPYFPRRQQGRKNWVLYLMCAGVCAMIVCGLVLSTKGAKTQLVGGRLVPVGHSQ